MMLVFAGPASAAVFKVFFIFTLFRLQNIRRRVKCLIIKYFIDKLLFFEPIFGMLSFLAISRISDNSIPSREIMSYIE
jgi:hypothetical protein